MFFFFEGALTVIYLFFTFGFESFSVVQFIPVVLPVKNTHKTTHTHTRKLNVIRVYKGKSFDMQIRST